MPPDQPMPNSPEARTETGDLKDPNLAPDPSLNTNPEPAKIEEPKKEGSSLLNQDEKKVEGEKKEPAKGEEKKADVKAGAPEKYEAFKAPEGYELDQAALDKATPLFKELGLNQDQAQKAIDLYSALHTQNEKAISDHWKQTQEDWVKEIGQDKEIGHKLAEVKATVSKALDLLGPELKKPFQEAMDLTGAGNNPAFVKGLFKLASMLTEGKHIPSGNPSKFANGEQAQKGPSALYPNLA